MEIKSNAAPVKFRNVTKQFDDVIAVNHISLDIEAGTLVTLLGPSGCGKTTCLRLIAGLEMPNSGKIMIGDKDVTSLSATQRDVTMVFQSYALFPHMNVIENVSYGLLSSKIPKKEAYAISRKWLSTVGLEGFEKRLPSELSGGQQQRVAVARALVLEPQVLLFDEPLSNLDAKLRRKMREDIRELQQELGITAVYVTHDQEEALAISDKIIVMENAIIAQEGTPRDLYEKPQTRFVARFMGDANLLKGSVKRINSNEVRVQLDKLEVFLQDRTSREGETQVAIRPESIEIHAHNPGEYCIEGEVLKSSYIGSHMEYTIQTSIGSLFAMDQNVTNPLLPKQHIYLSLKKQGLSLMPSVEEK